MVTAATMPAAPPKVLNVAPAQGLDQRLIGVLAIICAIESVLAAAHVKGLLDMAPALGLHALAVGLLGFALLRGRAGATSAPARPLALLTTAVAGPIGAAAGVLLAVLASRQGEAPERLAEWYRRLARSTALDPIAVLAGRAAVGRVIDTAQPLPHSLTEVMSQGTIGERQRALGLMARTFRPDYLPALRVALASPEPVVRVQAAAVAARARGPLGHHVAELARRADAATLDSAANFGAALALADDLEFCLASGLLEAVELDAARASADRLAIRVADHPELVHFDGDDEQRASIERQLLMTGRYDAFRHIRAGATMRRVGLYRVRTIGAGRVRRLAGRRTG